MLLTTDKVGKYIYLKISLELMTWHTNGQHISNNNMYVLITIFEFNSSGKQDLYIQNQERENIKNNYLGSVHRSSHEHKHPNASLN